MWLSYSTRSLYCLRIFVLIVSCIWYYSNFTNSFAKLYLKSLSLSVPRKQYSQQPIYSLKNFIKTNMVLAHGYCGRLNHRVLVLIMWAYKVITCVYTKIFNQVDLFVSMILCFGLIGFRFV